MSASFEINSLWDVATRLNYNGIEQLVTPSLFDKQFVKPRTSDERSQTGISWFFRDSKTLTVSRLSSERLQTVRPMNTINLSSIQLTTLMASSEKRLN